MKVLTLNIEHGRHLPKLFALIAQEQPDVLCLQEVFAEDVKVIKTQLNYTGYFAPIVNYQKTHGYSVDPRGIWGELLLINPKTTQLDKSDQHHGYHEHYYVGSPDLIPVFINPTEMNRVLQVVAVRVDNQSFMVANTHFTWSNDGISTVLQRQHFDQLVTYLDLYPKLILCGDFNAPRGKKIFSLFSSRYTDNVPSEVLTTIDNSFHYSGKQLNLVVDTIFTSTNYIVSNVRVICGVSDHCAIVGEVVNIGKNVNRRLTN